MNREPPGFVSTELNVGALVCQSMESGTPPVIPQPGDQLQSSSVNNIRPSETQRGSIFMHHGSEPSTFHTTQAGSTVAQEHQLADRQSRPTPSSGSVMLLSPFDSGLLGLGSAQSAASAALRTPSRASTGISSSADIIDRHLQSQSSSQLQSSLREQAAESDRQLREAGLRSRSRGGDIGR